MHRNSGSRLIGSLKASKIVVVLIAIVVFPAIAPAAESPATQTSERRPAKLYWGGYKQMDQLVQPGAEWDFVRQHMDAFFLHGAYWLHDKSAMDVAAKLAPLLKSAGKPCVLEVGWPHYTVDDLDNMGHHYAQEHADGIASLRAAGFDIGDVSIDWHIFIISMVARKHPDWSSADVLAQITGDRTNYRGPAYAGYFQDYVRDLHARFPDIRLYLCDSPVYMTWRGMACYGPQEMSPHPVHTDAGQTLMFNGKPVNLDIDGCDWLSSMMRVGAPNGMSGFITDSPFNYTCGWADPKARANHVKKILLYEKWLHDQSLKHVFVCNDSGKSYEHLSHQDWDSLYERDSLLALQNYQLAGGRADAYQLESWYDGPSTIVPETKPGSFSHLAAAAIRYLQGPGERLDLSARAGDNGAFIGGSIHPANEGAPREVVSDAPIPNFEVRLTNKGDSDCLPALTAEPAATVFYAGNEISEAAHSGQGWTPPALLKPGDSITLNVRLEAKGQPSARLSAYWNPQDPSSTVRDSIVLRAHAHLTRTGPI